MADYGTERYTLQVRAAGGSNWFTCKRFATSEHEAEQFAMRLALDPKQRIQGWRVIDEQAGSEAAHVRMLTPFDTTKLPKCLHRFAHLIKDISDEREAGDGYWVYLVKGFESDPKSQTHIVHESSPSACARAFKWVSPCDCDRCSDPSYPAANY